MAEKLSPYSLPLDLVPGDNLIMDKKGHEVSAKEVESAKPQFKNTTKISLEEFKAHWKYQMDVYGIKSI